MMKLPKVSIITVVWNDAKGLEKTIKSVLSQIYENVELIVIDGSSTDGTVAVIKKYKDKIDYWVTEKDEGIFDAMNKGISASTGMWINFMNAGDTFVNSYVLNKIAFNDLSQYTILYGNRIQNDIEKKPTEIKELEVGGFFACHQSMFFNKKLLNDCLKYNLKYKIYGDYELVNKIYRRYPNSFYYLSIAIADYLPGGISSTAINKKRIEKFRGIYSSYGIVGIINALIFRLKS